MRLEGGRSETRAILLLADEQRNATQVGPRHIFVGRLSLSFRGVGEVTQAGRQCSAVQSEGNLMGRAGKANGGPECAEAQVEMQERRRNSEWKEGRTLSQDGMGCNGTNRCPLMQLTNLLYGLSWAYGGTLGRAWIGLGIGWNGDVAGCDTVHRATLGGQ